jgi:hypothetical protein
VLAFYMCITTFKVRYTAESKGASVYSCRALLIIGAYALVNFSVKRVSVAFKSVESSLEAFDSKIYYRISSWRMRCRSFFSSFKTFYFSFQVKRGTLLVYKSSFDRVSSLLRLEVVSFFSFWDCFCKQFEWFATFSENLNCVLDLLQTSIQ